MNKRQTNPKYKLSVPADLITKAIYFFVTIGLIAFICRSIYPKGSAETMSDSYIHTENLVTVVTPTFHPEPTKAPASTSTPTPTCTPTPTSTPTPTFTPAPTNTPIPTNTPAPTCTPIPTPVFSGASYIVMDYTTGDILLSENPEERILPASTIKLLTAMVALDHATPNIPLELSEAALVDIQNDVTSFGARAGTTYSLEVWLHLLLIRSFGDAANAIAEGCGGTIEQFIILMNKKIADLGLVNTHVDNAIGLDSGNGFLDIYSTAEDMLSITMEALSYPLIREIIAKKSYQVPGTETTASVLIRNSNPFHLYSKYYFSDYFTTIGGKTGTTKAAGSCLVTLVTGIDGHEYLCVYYGGVNRDTMSREITGLLEYAIQINMTLQD